VTTKERKEMARVFYGAAELLISQEWFVSSGCCWAIKEQYAERDATYEVTDTTIKLFTGTFMKDAMRLRDHKGIAFWFRANSERCDDPEVRNRRILGLCLAAHLVETGGIG
jgi:hypothetical protein